MATTDTVFSIPAHSLIKMIDENYRHSYLALAIGAPKNVADLLFSPKTGAYIQGVVKAYDLPEDVAPQIAFGVLRVSLGLIPLANFAATLSSELKVANDVAQKMAAELEHDLFAPVAGELNTYLETRKLETRKLENKATGDPRAAGASNVLDLKNKPQPPVPPPIPPRPSLPKFPT